MLVNMKVFLGVNKKTALWKTKGKDLKHAQRGPSQQLSIRVGKICSILTEFIPLCSNVSVLTDAYSVTRNSSLSFVSIMLQVSALITHHRHVQKYVSETQISIPAGYY